MISKRDLRLGNVFEQGVVCKINGRTGAKVHLHGKLRYDKRIKVIESVDVKDLNPVVLTPQILKEWCGFKNGGSNGFLSWNRSDFPIMLKQTPKNFLYYISGIDLYVTYLHELQNLYYALNRTELEIKGY